MDLQGYHIDHPEELAVALHQVGDATLQLISKVCQCLGQGVLIELEADTLCPEQITQGRLCPWGLLRSQIRLLNPLAATGVHPMCPTIRLWQPAPVMQQPLLV